MTFLMTPKKKSSKEQVKSEQFLSNQSSATVWRHFAVTGLRFDWCTPGDHGHLSLSFSPIRWSGTTRSWNRFGVFGRVSIRRGRFVIRHYNGNAGAQQNMYIEKRPLPVRPLGVAFYCRLVSAIKLTCDFNPLGAVERSIASSFSVELSESSHVASCRAVNPC